MSPLKKDIRREYLQQRIAMSLEKATMLNARLLEQCKQLDYTNVQYIHIFLPISGKLEADTYGIVQWLRETLPQLHLVISRSDLSSGEMLHYLWEESTEIASNHFGIPEPVNGRLITPDQLDLIFVPLLAFDERGHRVGYGKGMYDLFLSQCRPSAQKVGLSFFEPVPVIEDTYDGDVALDIVLTPDHIYHFTTK
ncbi:5-formyltetrahydrofolate cyclo-ligase [Chitinophaga sedimenti]|uniref:5-formyltetrahydrofolate cyclo-ligase n=1 Tax=Chitinophaga sedimenti TaxID=2033606 RepID=UPI002002DBD5|nr:5-formyltetrahydrofolate cyclo-ligase [Chitinophaga sedimenti]MCK7555307.1 5-formyltetrahydrofolate cyclo-ligase [Chitinophaga sedimenti]